MVTRVISNTSIHHTTAQGISAEAQLAELGYKQELPRKLGMMSILGLSFAIMAVPFGVSTTMYIGLTDGQYVTVFWGWCVVSAISLCIAASLAEICSVYPTSGGVYYWAAMLANEKWAPIASWITGWLTLVGNWTVTTSICFSGGQLILSSITLWREGWEPTTWQTVLMFWAVMVFCALVNYLCSGYLDLINKVCVYWTGASVIIILIVLSVMAPERNSAKTVLGHFDASASGWTPGWAFFVGLLQAAYTLTGYGMVAAMCEEVQNPEREVPKAIVLSVAAAALTGIVYLLSVLFTMPMHLIAELLTYPSGVQIGFFFKFVTGSAGGGFGLLFLLLGILMFAGIGALTAASRCTYAFARDGAIPMSKWWRHVDKRFETPSGGILLSTTICCLLGLIYFGSSAAFGAFTGVATICLSASYALPVFVSIIQKRAKLQNAPFFLGNTLGIFVNIVTVLWILLATVLFCMPTAIPVTAESMNYASVVFMGFFSISALWYFVWGRKHFKGPVSNIDEGSASDASFPDNTISKKNDDIYIVDGREMVEPTTLEGSFNTK